MPVAPQFQRNLRRLGDHPLIREARGVGLVGSLEPVEDKAGRRSFDPSAGVAAYVGLRA